MKDEVRTLLSPLIGQECCRIAIGRGNSIALGFGKKLYHNKPNLRMPYYGEWELFAYYCAWRIRKGNEPLVGKNDSYERDEMEGRIADLMLSHVATITELNELDIRMTFDTGFIVEIFATTTDVDVYYSFWLPGSKALERVRGGNWILMDSDKPLAEANARIL